MTPCASACKYQYQPHVGMWSSADITPAEDFALAFFPPRCAFAPRRARGSRSSYCLGGLDGGASSDETTKGLLLDPSCCAWRWFLCGGMKGGVASE